MGQPLLKTRKTIIITAFIIFVAGIFFYTLLGVFHTSKDLSEQIRLTEQLPENIKKLLGETTFKSNDPSFDEMVTQPVDEAIQYSFVKYLYFDDQIAGGKKTGTKLEAYIDKDMNERLNTVKYSNGNDLDGIILKKLNLLQVGAYYSKTGDKKQANAYQPYYTLTFIKLPEQRVVRRDTLWGRPPAEEIKKDGSFMGEYPSTEAVIAQIKKSVSN